MVSSSRHSSPFLFLSMFLNTWCVMPLKALESTNLAMAAEAYVSPRQGSEAWKCVAGAGKRAGGFARSMCAQCVLQEAPCP